MNIEAAILADLRAHQSLCRDLLTLAERESQWLRTSVSNPAAAAPESNPARRAFLPELTESLTRLRHHREAWQKLTAQERAAQPTVGFMLRQVQDLIMRIILLDRENEQALLRRGMIPPREIPPAQQQRPHFVASLYQRGAA